MSNFIKYINGDGKVKFLNLDLCRSIEIESDNQVIVEFEGGDRRSVFTDSKKLTQQLYERTNIKD